MYVLCISTVSWRILIVLHNMLSLQIIIFHLSANVLKYTIPYKLHNVTQGHLSDISKQELQIPPLEMVYLPYSGRRRASMTYSLPAPSIVPREKEATLLFSL